MEVKNICLVELLCIGLPAGSLLETKGFEVFRVDVSKNVFNTMNCRKTFILQSDFDIPAKSSVNDIYRTTAARQWEAASSFRSFFRDEIHETNAAKAEMGNVTENALNDAHTFDTKVCYENE